MLPKLLIFSISST